MKGVVLLLAGGDGVRLDDVVPKAFVELAGTTILRRAAEAAAGAELVESLVVAAPAGQESRAEALLSGLAKPVRIVSGGATRQASASSALRAAAGDAVAVHDAARALCPPALFDVCLAELDGCEAVCPALPVSDTIKEVSADAVVATMDRSRLAAAQTPQTFRTEVYRRAHERAAADGYEGTDDCALVERLGVPVRIVPGDPRNLKITTPTDLALAAILLGA